MQPEYERISEALGRIRNRDAREEIASAIEGLADAYEMIPTGRGVTDIHAEGFESIVPGAPHVFAATVWREGRRSIRDIAKASNRLRHILQHQGTGQTWYANMNGRQTILTKPLIERARILRDGGMLVTPVNRRLAIDFGVSVSALWGCLERGSSGSPGSPERLFWQAMYEREESR